MTRPPEVWKYGPVFDDLYNIRSGHGGREIRESQKLRPFQRAPGVPEDERDTHQLINFVWERYGGYSPIKLSDMTHEPGTPWEIVARENKYRVPKNTPIPDNIIADYFKKISASAGRMEKRAKFSSIVTPKGRRKITSSQRMTNASTSWNAIF